MFDLGSIEKAFSLNKQGVVPPAVICAFVPERDLYDDIHEIFTRVDLFFDSKCEALSIEPVTVPGARWEIQLKITFESQENTFIVWSGKGPFSAGFLSEARGLSKLEKNAVIKSSRYIGIASMADISSFKTMKTLYNILFHVVPDAIGFFDVNSSQIHGARLVRRAVYSASQLPPAMMYSTKENEETISTRGLSRYAFPDLIVDKSPVPEADCSGLIERAVDSLFAFGCPEEGEVLYLGKSVTLLLIDDEESRNSVFLCSVRKKDGLPQSAVIHYGEFTDSQSIPTSEEDARKRRLTAIEYFPDCRQFYKKSLKRKLPSEAVLVLVGLSDEGPATCARKFSWYMVRTFTDNGFFGFPLRQGSDLATVDSGKLNYFDSSFIIDWRIQCANKVYSPSEAILAL